jgi:hypothetical protein
MKSAAGVLAAASTAVAVALAGCGGGVQAADLFVVYRSGTVPGANLTLLINEEGVVHCDNGPPLPIDDSQLVLARGIQEELEGPSSKHLYLPPRPGSVLNYYVRDQEGTVRFSDNSLGKPKALRELQALVLQLAQGVCHRGV